MKKIAVPIIVAFLVLNACGTISSLPPAQPTQDKQASSAGQASTISAMTLAAISTPTVAPATQTKTPILLPSPISATDTSTSVPFTETSAVQLPILATPTATIPPTGTGVISTATSIPASNSGPTITATATFGGHQTYGTLPPKVPSNNVRVINKSKAQAYISLQCTIRNKQNTIIEYSVRKSVVIDTPIGSCLYVTWVGGRKFSGSFTNNANIPVTITLYLDRVTVK